MKTLHVPLLLAFVTFLSPIVSSRAADLKIGTVDLKKVFEDYFKTKLADAAIKEEASALDKDLKGMTDEHQKAVEDYKKALDEANNQAVSAEERDKRKKEAEGKLIKINDLRQGIEQFNRTAKGNMEEKLLQTRNKILAEIKAVIATKSKSGGFTHVIDSSSPEPGGRPPVLLYTSGENDLTAGILDQLNSTAPSDFLKSNDNKDGKKEDKKDEKK